MTLSLFKNPLLLITTLFIMNSTLPALASDQQTPSTTLEEKLTTLENSFDGRIGIYAVNTTNNSQLQFNAEEHFPFQSTFKVMVVSAILKKSMSDKHFLQQKISYSKKDLVFWSPITEKHVADGKMTIADLCAAALMYSDNAATNLLMKKLGGPEAVTGFARSIGDSTFRVSGWEPDLNSNPNDLHDTSTPLAMEKSLQKLTLGDVFAPAQREQLVTWMKGCTTGDTRIRAGVPQGWVVADKTGAGNDFGIANDIGIIWPAKCAPIVVTIFTVHKKKDSERRDDIVASATRILLEEFAKTDQCIKLKS